MDASVPNWGPRLDVVLIMFFINPCDLHKSITNQTQALTAERWILFRGYFFLSLFLLLSGEN